MSSALLQIIVATAVSTALALTFLPFIQRRYAYWKLYLRLKSTSSKMRMLNEWLADEIMNVAKQTRKKAIGI